MTYSQIRARTHLLVEMSLITAMVFVTFLPTQISSSAHVEAASTPIHSRDSWSGKEWISDGVRSMTFKVKSIVPNKYGYSIIGSYDGDVACQGQEGTLSQLNQSQYAVQDAINIWGHSPIGRYINCDIPHFGDFEIVEGNNERLMGFEGWVGGPGGKFDLNKNIVPSGIWIYPNNNFSFVQGNSYTLIARAYQTHPTDPAISYVNVTGYWSNAWHVICHIPNNRSDLGDFYYCSTNLKINGKYPRAGTMKLSFDIYDINGSKNLAPNGTPTGMFSTKQPIPVLSYYPYQPPSAQLQTIGTINPTAAKLVVCLASLAVPTLKVLGLGGRTFKMVNALWEIYDKGSTGVAIFQDSSNGNWKGIVMDLAKAAIPGESCLELIHDLTPIRPVY